MLMFNLIKQLRKFRKIRFYSTNNNLDINKIRNIGILAHIDAGKTTTTERMLYFSGLINHMGEVHHGNTVTDYMDQERERGITITSAAVTFFWKNHQLNLIDTPGHIDFTMEVEQTLRVLDGAVVVLDGSAGVEAQTLTVWKQADRHDLPRVIFVNKMDRKDACFEMSCKSVEEKLEKPTLQLQLPIIENGSLTGLVDIVSLQRIIFNKTKGKQVEYENLDEKTSSKLWHDAKMARSRLVDRLCEFNDRLADLVITSGSLDDIKAVDIVTCLREVTLRQQAIPVLMGSSYKNIGVQPLIDAAILYLPSPTDHCKHFSAFGGNLCARAFKVMHDKQKGPLVFFRIYNGSLAKSQRLYNIQQDKTEPIGRLYQAFADEFREMDTITNGNIAVVSGLKHTMSGEMVTDSQSAMQKAKTNMIKLRTKEEIIDNVFTTRGHVPEPVFFCSIEPPSMAYQSGLDQALNELQREDPSLRVHYDSETGQTVLSGMGELHLEIIRDRILKEYKINAELGALQIAYREKPLNKVSDQLFVDTKIGNAKQNVNVKLSLIPTNRVGGDFLRLDRSAEAASNISSIFPKHFLAIRQGIEIGLAHGPKVGAQVINAEVMLHWFEVGRGTSESMISACVTQLVQKLLKESGCNILEPMMFLEIVTPDEYVSQIMADLSKRRSNVEGVSVRGNMKVISCNVPLAKLMGYSTTLRTVSSGTATFTMEFNEYHIMSPIDENIAIQNIRGF